MASRNWVLVNKSKLAGADGDSDFNSLTDAPQGTFDAAYIEITFIPSEDVIRGTFTFASEEYNEYAPPAGSLSGGNTTSKKTVSLLKLV